MRKILLVVLVLTGAVGLIVAIWAGDKLLSRPDRADLARIEDDWLTIHDALLHFEHERGYLPESLDALIPRYLRPDQLRTGTNPLYLYERDARRLAVIEPIVITGLWRRQARIDRALPTAPETVTRGLFSLHETADRLQVPQGAALAEPPPGAYVFEAEHYSTTNYGWEIRADGASSGGAFIHTKEGVGNGPGQIHAGVYDFYNIEEKKEYASLAYHIHLPEVGRYYLYGRMWTTGSHCSNILIVGVNTTDPSTGSSGDYAGVSMANTAPFRWLWTAAGNRPFRLDAGDHMIHVYIHEDGIHLDQFILSPTRISGDTPFQPNLLPNRGTAFADSLQSPLHLTFDLDSIVLDPDCPPRGNLVLRRLDQAEGLVMVDIFLDDAVTGQLHSRLKHYEVDAATLPEVAFLPLDLEDLDIAAMPRREYLLRAEARLGDRLLASRHRPLMRPFAWEVSPTFDYLDISAAGPLDPGAAAATDWTPFACANLDAFGVLDFGLHTTGNSLHADQWKTIYARTSIQVETTGDYLFKIQSDDQMLLWLDGQLVYRHPQQAPVTRSVGRPTIHLTAGTHTLLMRVNQAGMSDWQDGRWQASLRIRTPGDRLSTVIGLNPIPSPAAD